MYNNNVEAPIRLLPYQIIKKITAVLVAGRLSFFININDKCNNCNNKCAKKEKCFPSNVHWHPLLSRGRKKDFNFPEIEEATAPIWYSYGLSPRLLYHI